MMLDSVVAFVFFGHRDGDHLSLDPSEPGGSPHEMGVQPEVSLERRRVEAVDLENVVDLSRGFTVAPIQLRELSLGFILPNHANPGHPRTSSDNQRSIR